MYSKLAAQDDTLPVHDFCCEAWSDDEVVVLREHVQRVGTREWALCAKRVSAVFGSPGRTYGACAQYYRDNDFVAGADGAVEVKTKTKAMQKARRPRPDHIARPASLFRRRPRPHEIAC